MLPSDLPHPQRQSLAYARIRDERICWLLDTHPVTAAMLVDLRLFPTRSKARRRLRRLVARSKVRFVGTICGPSGSPEHVYCRWTPSVGHLLHEIEVTQFCLKLDADRITRGPHLLDDRFHPDAEVWINGHLYYLELDRGTMSYSQISERFRKYEECRQFVLWVCATESRSDALRARSERVRHNAIFTTFADALTDPHGTVWLDRTGERATLPRNVEQKPEGPVVAGVASPPAADSPEGMIAP